MSQSHEVTGTPTHRYRHLVSTNTKTTQCHRCAGDTLEALEDGLLVRVDATPLDGQAGELAALTQGRDTYTRTPGGLLIQRTAARITSGWLKGTLHAEHRCDPAQIQEALF